MDDRGKAAADVKERGLVARSMKIFLLTISRSSSEHNLNTEPPFCGIVQRFACQCRLVAVDQYDMGAPGKALRSWSLACASSRISAAIRWCDVTRSARR